jgi:hypothetical protein
MGYYAGMTAWQFAGSISWKMAVEISDSWIACRPMSCTEPCFVDHPAVFGREFGLASPIGFTLTTPV